MLLSYVYDPAVYTLYRSHSGSDVREITSDQTGVSVSSASTAVFILLLSLYSYTTYTSIPGGDSGKSSYNTHVHLIEL